MNVSQGIVALCASQYETRKEEKPIMPKPGEQLSVAQRACLLRAARERLMQLHDMAQATYLAGGTESLEAHLSEIRCVEEAIAWLWRYTINGEP